MASAYRMGRGNRHYLKCFEATSVAQWTERLALQQRDGLHSDAANGFRSGRPHPVTQC